MKEKKLPYDLNTIVLYLQNKNLYESLGLPLIEKYTKAQYIINVDNVIEMLTERKNKRSIVNFLNSVKDDIKSGKFSVEDYVGITEQFIKSFQPKEIEEIVHIKTLANSNLDDIFKRSHYHKTGIWEIDNNIHGFFNGQLVVIASRPGAGKSTLALQIARNFDGDVLFVSLEMNRAELFARTLSSIANVESWKIEIKKMDNEEFKKVFNAAKILSNFGNILLIDSLSDMRKIINYMRELCEKKKIKAVVIDYLQLMTGSKGTTKNDQIQFVTRNLKLFAQEYNIPIILLSQLSREVERLDREPILSDLRESGAIEQDADVVIFLHKDLDADCIKLIVAKNRKGRVAKEKILFEKQYVRFGTVPENKKQMDIDRQENIQINMEYIHD
jgi:replicative DNA helicase